MTLEAIKQVVAMQRHDAVGCKLADAFTDITVKSQLHQCILKDSFYIYKYLLTSAMCETVHIPPK